MRTLLPLNVEGRGTGDIEALPSYLSRLAAAHGVTPGVLFLHFFNSYEGGLALSKTLAAQPYAASVRPTAAAESAVRMLARSKCEDEEQLRRCTFLYLMPALAHTHSAYIRRLRWCPACLYEQQLTCGTPYLKMSWFLEAVQVCHIHRVTLRERCPHCKNVPRPWRGWPSFARCPKCDGKLDVVSPCDQIVLSPEACAPDLVALIEHIACRGEPFPIGAINRYIDKIFSEAWNTGRERELWGKLPRDECLHFASTDASINLPIARRIAYRLEIPIAELLDGAQPATHSFAFASEAPLPLPMQPKRQSFTIDAVELTARLRSILAEPEDPPPTLRQIAYRVGISVAAMKYHCPVLAAQLSARRTSWRQQGSIRKRTDASRAVEEGIAHWYDTQTTPMTRNALLLSLSRRSLLPTELLRRAIRIHWATYEGEVPQLIKP